MLFGSQRTIGIAFLCAITLTCSLILPACRGRHHSAKVSAAGEGTAALAR